MALAARKITTATSRGLTPGLAALLGVLGKDMDRSLAPSAAVTVARAWAERTWARSSEAKEDLIRPGLPLDRTCPEGAPAK